MSSKAVRLTELDSGLIEVTLDSEAKQGPTASATASTAKEVRTALNDLYTVRDLFTACPYSSGHYSEDLSGFQAPVGNFRSIKVGKNDIWYPMSFINTRTITLYNVQMEGDEPKILGKGSYGVVLSYKPLSGDSGEYEQKIAVKIVKDDSNDVRMARYIEGNNIKCGVIPSRVLMSIRGNTLILMPAMKGSLSSMDGLQALPDGAKIRLCKVIVDQVACLAAHDLYYSDMKPSNILFRCMDKGIALVSLGDIGSIATLNSDSVIFSLPVPTLDFDTFNAKFKIASSKRREMLNMLCVWALILTMLFMWVKNRVYELSDKRYSDTDVPQFTRAVATLDEYARKARVLSPIVKAFFTRDMKYSGLTIAQLKEMVDSLVESHRDKEEEESYIFVTDEVKKAASGRAGRTPPSGERLSGMSSLLFDLSL